MNNKKETDFIFAVGITLTLFTVVLILFCGEDFLKKLGFCWIKTGLIISFSIFSVLLLVSLVFLLSTSNDKEDPKSWIVITKDDAQINKNAEKIMFDTDVTSITSVLIKNLDNLEKVEIYGTPEIGKYAFLKCKNLQEVTFYENPKSIDETAFAGCSSLTTVNLIGNDEKWKSFKITVPKNCKIKFIEQQSLIISAESKEVKNENR